MVSIDNKFSQVPEWMLDADVSDGAFRLYAALMRYADYKDGTCYPSRSTLAKRIRKSDRSVDGYMKELVKVGAVLVTHRYRDAEKKEQISSRYTVITADPSFVAPPREEIFATPSEEEFAHPGEADFAQTITTTTDTHLNKRRARKRAARLPEGWMPDQRVIEHMRAECPGVNLEAEHRKFADHWAAASGEKASKLDWNAAWRNWIRRAAEHDRRNNTYTPSWQKRLDANVQAAQADMNRDRGIFEIGE